MELKDTVSLMLSEDYRERFVAEYSQLAIRYKGLKKMLQKWEDGTLEFAPTCSRDLLMRQSWLMWDYLCLLRARADIENVGLPDVSF